MRKATKACGNVYYCARIAAAACNEALCSREGASELLGIERTRLAHIELDTIQPHPDEVRMMADVYNAPEILNWHCSNVCPVGRCLIPEVHPGSSIEQIAIRSAQALRDTEDIREALIDIAADGQITPDERPQFEFALKKLQEISRVSLELHTLALKVGRREEASE